MKTGILVCNGNSHYAYKQFHKEAEKRNVILKDYWEHLPEADFTLNRQYLEKHIKVQQGVQVNKMVDGIFWRDKIRQLEVLETLCPKPQYIIGRELGFDYIVEHLGIPFIAKENFSSMGNGVYYIRNRDDFEKAKYCSIFQEVIWDSLGSDVRVYCIGGRPVRCMLRKNEDDFRSNFHQGGACHKYTLSSEIRDITERIYQQTNLDIMGIDLMVDKDGYVFCELNTNPGFEGIDSVYNCNTAGEILDFVLRKCN